MSRRDTFVEHLAQVPLFSACSKKDLAQVARLSDEITVPAGKALVEEGSVGREFFVIMDGTAKVSRNGRKVATLGPGDAFGELALLVKAPRNASVAAETPMSVVVIGQREFSGLLDEVPGFSRKLLTGVAQRLRDADISAPRR